MKSRKNSKSHLKITSLEIMHLVNELQKFAGKRVDNVYHGDGRLFLKISSQNGIEIRPDVIFASKGFASESTQFSQMLRKHLKGRKILGIEQHDFDRIAVIRFSEGILVAELFHSGNIVLCNSGMKIIIASDQRHWKDRSIMPGSIYKFPEGVDITKSGEFMDAMNNSEKVVSFLVKNGMGFHAEEVLERCGIDKSAACSSLSSDDRKKLFMEIMSLLKKEPSISGGYLEKALQNEDFTVLDKQKLAVEKMGMKERELRAIAEKIYEKFGEISLSRGMKDVEIGGMKIKINPSISLQKNADKYFEESKKLRGKIERAKVEMKKHIEIQKERKKEWYHKFRWFFTSDSFLVIAGKDAKTNSDIIRKHLESGDIVIHAEIHGAAFAVMKCRKPAAKQALEEAMQFAACHSKAWAMQLGTIDVYWVKPDQVIKQQSGMGTFSIVGEKNYIRRMELRMGCGFVKDELQVLPHKVFEHLGLKCVPVYTGDIKARELAKKIRDRLKQLYIDKAKEIDGMPLSEIESRIPYGRGSV